MFIVSYLAQDDSHLSAVRSRLALARHPKGVIPAYSVTELVNQVQTLPVNMVIVDMGWPRATWSQVTTDLRATHPTLPIVALAPGATDDEWWRLADDLFRLDEEVDLFLHRLERIERQMTPCGISLPLAGGMSSPRATPASHASPTVTPGSYSFLDNPQLRQFAAIFSETDESTITDAFVAWVQQVCQTSRVVMLLSDPLTGDFECHAQRGLSSTLVPHCRFPQTAPLCTWFMSTSHIVLRENSPDFLPVEVVRGLDLMQAAVAVPILLDGQLVGILGVGPRLVGQGYAANELEGLFALSGQLAMVLHHRRMHRLLRAQQELTERMLSVIPTGIVVLGQDNRIAFVNANAGVILDRPSVTLTGRDLRALPSPLGDLVFESLFHQRDLACREVTLAPSGRPVRIACSFLATNPPSAMLLIEDLSTQKSLEEERGRRFDLEMVTNLVHYLAHELRNPLVALSTYPRLAMSKADDTDFHQFIETVIPGEIERINIVLEQLLILTNHAEFQYSVVDLSALLRRMIIAPDFQAAVNSTLPGETTLVYGDIHRLETALICILRSLMRLSAQGTQIDLQVTADKQEIRLCAEVSIAQEVFPERLLHPWQQLMSHTEQEVDFGLATAHFILEQHRGTLSVSVSGNTLVCLCRLPQNTGGDEEEEAHHGAQRNRSYSR